MDRDYYANHDNNRVIVEQWNGRIKHAFKILSDDGGYRGNMDMIDYIVTFCVCVYNQLARLRGFPGYIAPACRSAVPMPEPVPAGDPGSTHGPSTASCALSKAGAPSAYSNPSTVL